MKQKTRKPKVANIGYVGTEIITGQSAKPNVGANPSRTSEVDYKQKYEQQKEEIEVMKSDNKKLIEYGFTLANKADVQKSQIHRLNSQVGGYKKNLNDAKDTIKALTADVNGLKATNLSINNARQSLVRKVEANDAYISQLAKDLRISKDKVISLASELKSIKCKWLYKLFN